MSLPGSNHTVVKFRRGTTVQNNTLTGQQGEITIDIDRNTAVIHDGFQLGGYPLRRDDQVETRVRYLTFRAAITQQGIPSLGFSSPENAPTPITIMENNILTAAAAFAQNVGQSIQDHFMLPFDWVAPLGLEIVWRAASYTGNVQWKVETCGIPIGGYFETASFNTPVEVQAIPGTDPYQLVTTVIDSLPTINMVPDGEVFYKLTRMADTMVTDAELLSLRFLVRVRGK